MDKTQLNSEFQKLDVDHLYHLGLDSSMDLKGQFGDVRFVVLTRSFNNADYFANQFIHENYHLKNLQVMAKTIAKDERYHIYKVANTLIISHGVGFPSMLICLNEVVKLLWHAGVEDYKFIRLGAGGGVGIPSGSVVIASEALNQQLYPEWSNIEFGDYYTYPTPLDQSLADELMAFSPASKDLIKGKVMGSSSFYNGQARLNGALAVSYNKAERNAYLQRAHAAGVRGVDMETSCFAGFCHKLGIPATAVIATLTDRLTDDDSEPSLAVGTNNLSPILQQAGQVIINYILSKTPSTI